LGIEFGRRWITAALAHFISVEAALIPLLSYWRGSLLLADHTMADVPIVLDNGTGFVKVRVSHALPTDNLPRSPALAFSSWRKVDSGSLATPARTSLSTPSPPLSAAQSSAQKNA